MLYQFAAETQSQIAIRFRDEIEVTHGIGVYKYHSFQRTLLLRIIS